MAITDRQPFKKAGFGPLDSYFLNAGGLNIDYLLEVRAGGELQTLLPLPAQPNNVQITKTYAERVTYTFKEDFAYREIGKARRGQVVLTGQVTAKRVLNIDASIDGQAELRNIPGEEHLKNLDTFFKNYHEKASSTSALPNGNTLPTLNVANYEAQRHLVIRCLKENIHARCTVAGFTYNRSVDKHRVGGFDWQLTLNLYDEAQGAVPDFGFGFLEFAKQAEQFLADISGVIDTISGSIDATIGQVSGALSGVLSQTRAVFAAAQTLLEAPGRVVGAIGGLVKDVIDTIDVLTATLNRGWETVKAIFGQSDDISLYSPLTSIDDYWRATDFWAENAVATAVEPIPLDRPPPRPVLGRNQQSQLITVYNVLDGLRAVLQLVSFYGGMRMSRDQAVAGEVGFLGSSFGFAGLAAINPRVSLPTAAQNAAAPYAGPHIIYTMGSGDSLLTVAYELLGDPELWTELAEVNRCLDAYTLGDGSPIIPGTRIIVPVQSNLLMTDLGSGRGVIDTSSDTDSDREYYGTDLYIDPATGDLVLLNQLGEDVRLVSDLNNLKQVILILVKTALGEVTADPRFGTNIRSAIGSKFTEQTATYLAVTLREQLLTDPRIIDVRDIVVAPNYATQCLEVSMGVLSFNGERVNVILPV